ncbi:hypothetical protein BUALT_Bualt04G0003500 [Buddleja alternifolia]|uniref:Uncharacterized protein n=1 Tax=Buddleja alternifolia TaxID=168488 RepID=A0AAV6XRQ7_9LAMI|nr:hypothetical protein BUALT_Bualt04G0003500 [Buddleja alternifolia]
MFRALSTRRSRRGYDQLRGGDDASTAAAPAPMLSRAKSLPAKIFGSSKKLQSMNIPCEQVKKASKIHPLFSIFETKRKKKATAKPEFSRYLEYVKEGGVVILQEFEFYAYDCDFVGSESRSS